MSNVYTCERCKFLFERVGKPENCPDCGSPHIRLANKDEQEEYRRLIEEFGKRVQ